MPLTYTTYRTTPVFGNPFWNAFAPVSAATSYHESGNTNSTWNTSSGSGGYNQETVSQETQAPAGASSYAAKGSTTDYGIFNGNTNSVTISNGATSSIFSTAIVSSSFQEVIRWTNNSAQGASYSNQTNSSGGFTVSHASGSGSTTGQSSRYFPIVIGSTTQTTFSFHPVKSTTSTYLYPVISSTTRSSTTNTGTGTTTASTTVFTSTASNVTQTSSLLVSFTATSKTESYSISTTTTGYQTALTGYGPWETDTVVLAFTGGTGNAYDVIIGNTATPSNLVPNEVLLLPSFVTGSSVVALDQFTTATATATTLQYATSSSLITLVPIAPYSQAVRYNTGTQYQFVPPLGMYPDSVFTTQSNYVSSADTLTATLFTGSTTTDATDPCQPGTTWTGTPGETTTTFDGRFVTYFFSGPDPNIGSISFYTIPSTDISTFSRMPVASAWDTYNIASTFNLTISSYTARSISFGTGVTDTDGNTDITGHTFYTSTFTDSVCSTNNTTILTIPVVPWVNLLECSTTSYTTGTSTLTSTISTVVPTTTVSFYLAPVWTTDYLPSPFSQLFGPLTNSTFTAFSGNTQTTTRSKTLSVTASTMLDKSYLPAFIPYNSTAFAPSGAGTTTTVEFAVTTQTTPGITTVVTSTLFTDTTVWSTAIANVPGENYSLSGTWLGGYSTSQSNYLYTSGSTLSAGLSSFTQLILNPWNTSSQPGGQSVLNQTTVTPVMAGGFAPLGQVRGDSAGNVFYSFAFAPESTYLWSTYTTAGVPTTIFGLPETNNAVTTTLATLTLDNTDNFWVTDLGKPLFSLNGSPRILPMGQAYNLLAFPWASTAGPQALLTTLTASSYQTTSTATTSTTNQTTTASNGMGTFTTASTTATAPSTTGTGTVTYFDNSLMTVPAPMLVTGGGRAYETNIGNFYFITNDPIGVTSIDFLAMSTDQAVMRLSSYKTTTGSINTTSSRTGTISTSGYSSTSTTSGTQTQSTAILTTTTGSYNALVIATGTLSLGSSGSSWNGCNSTPYAIGQVTDSRVNTFLTQYPMYNLADTWVSDVTRQTNAFTPVYYINAIGGYGYSSLGTSETGDTLLLQQGQYVVWSNNTSALTKITDYFTSYTASTDTIAYEQFPLFTIFQASSTSPFVTPNNYSLYFVTNATLFNRLGDDPFLQDYAYTLLTNSPPSV